MCLYRFQSLVSRTCSVLRRLLLGFRSSPSTVALSFSSHGCCFVRCVRGRVTQRCMPFVLPASRLGAQREPRAPPGRTLHRPSSAMGLILDVVCAPCNRVANWILKSPAPAIPAAVASTGDASDAADATASLLDGSAVAATTGTGATATERVVTMRTSHGGHFAYSPQLRRCIARDNWKEVHAADRGATAWQPGRAASTSAQKRATCVFNS